MKPKTFMERQLSINNDGSAIKILLWIPFAFQLQRCVSLALVFSDMFSSRISGHAELRIKDLLLSQFRSV
jgi:hypothetical protein